MALASWLCSKNTGRSQFVRLVFPGGHVELLNRPILAEKIMMQNPRFCVAYPDVFRDPSAVATPDTVLSLGHKYYVVPMSTTRRLQRHSPRRLGSSPSLTLRRQASSGHEMSYKPGKKWFKCLVNSRAKVKRPEGMSHGSKMGSSDMRETDMKRAQENWNTGIGGSPGRRVWRSSPGTTAHSWQPSLQSITEE